MVALIAIHEGILDYWCPSSQHSTYCSPLSNGGYEFGLEIESVLGKFEKTIYNDI